MNDEPVSYMTALQLADFIDANVAPFMNDHQMYLDYATVMLRQQQAEIESLLQFIAERGETGQLIIWKAQEK